MNKKEVVNLELFFEKIRQLDRRISAILFSYNDRIKFLSGIHLQRVTAISAQIVQIRHLTTEGKSKEVSEATIIAKSLAKKTLADFRKEMITLAGFRSTEKDFLALSEAENSTIDSEIEMFEKEIAELSRFDSLDGLSQDTLSKIQFSTKRIGEALNAVASEKILVDQINTFLSRLSESIRNQQTLAINHQNILVEISRGNLESRRGILHDDELTSTHAIFQVAVQEEGEKIIKPLNAVLTRKFDAQTFAEEAIAKPSVPSIGDIFSSVFSPSKLITKVRARFSGTQLSIEDVRHDTAALRFAEEKTEYLGLLLAHPQLLTKGTITEVSSLLINISKEVENLRAAAKKAGYDDRFPDLKVLSFGAITTLLQNEIGASLREPRSPVSVILFDLDWFKAVNDSYGHDVGDKVLTRFCKVCTASRRERDSFGSAGMGEEFLLVLPNTIIDDAIDLGNKIRQHVMALPVLEKYYHEKIVVTVKKEMQKQPSQNKKQVLRLVKANFKKNHIRNKITVSAGVATFPTDIEDIQGIFPVGKITKAQIASWAKQLRKKADDNVYIAKGNKDAPLRNTIVSSKKIIQGKIA